MIDNHGSQGDEMRLILVAMVVALIASPILVPVMITRAIGRRVRKAWGRQ